MTSSGIRSSSISWRMKSKSGWLADGKPTSISLKPIATTASNIRRLRTGSIGSISAWLPSRRSTEHHSGALSMMRSGQVRSWSTIGTYGRYLSKGIGSGGGGCGWHRGLLAGRTDGCGGAKNEEAPGRGGGGGRTREVRRSPYVSRRRRDGDSSTGTVHVARDAGQRRNSRSGTPRPLTVHGCGRPRRRLRRRRGGPARGLSPWPAPRAPVVELSARNT